MFRILSFLFILNNSQCSLININQNLIQSLINNLNIKHSIIIKDSNFQIEEEILNFVKELSGQKIFASFLSVNQINDLMYYYDKKMKLNEQREDFVFPPKTIVLTNLEKEIYQLFTFKNEYKVSRYVWLILKDFNESLITSEDLYIPYNCLFLRVKNSSDDIEEIYHPSLWRVNLFQRRLGSWKRNNKELKIIEPDFYARRLNMNGTTLYSFYLEGDDGSIFFCNEVMQEMAKVMNFRWILLSKNEYLNKMAENDNKEIGEMVFLLNMISHFDFRYFSIWPFWEKLFYIYIRHGENLERRDISQLLLPFSFHLWTAIAIWLIISGISQIIIHYFSEIITKSKKASHTLLINHFYEPFEIFFHQSENTNQTTLSLRIITTAINFVVLFIASAYSSAILSHILFPRISLPFTNMEEFVKDGTFKLGYIYNSGVDNWLKGTNDKWTKIAYEKYSRSFDGILSEPIFAAFNELCKDHKLAVIHLSIVYKKAQCKIYEIKYPFFSAWIAMTLRNNSPYERIFNRLLKTMRSSGLIKKKLWNLFISSTLDKNFFKLNNDIGVNFWSVKAIFNITGILYVVSVGILIIEIMHDYIRKKLKKNFEI